MNKALNSTLKYLIEIIIVAFGVFLGVYYSNVNAENKTQQEKNESIRLIINEIEYNKLLLERHIEYHEKIKIETDSIVPGLSKQEIHASLIQAQFDIMEIKGWNGINFARLQNTAYEAAKISGIIKEFDLELIQKLSQLYSIQSAYIDFGTTILNEAIGLNSSMKTWDLIRLTELMTSDLLGLEKQLLVEIEKIITELKNAT